MKDKIHPKYDKVVVHCGCGNTFETRSTADAIHAETCSMCHPFYTGKQRFMDTAGRIERFTEEVRQIVHQAAQRRTAEEVAAPTTVRQAPVFATARAGAFYYEAEFCKRDVGPTSLLQKANDEQRIEQQSDRHPR